MIEEASPQLRYSPRPVNEYVSPSGHGPGKDISVDRIEVWNLAYLSHDFDRSLLHPDPSFLVHVRRTCQVDIATGEPDLTFGLRGADLLASRLQMPAPWFVNWLMKNRKLMLKLPLYQTYGQAWLSTVERRCRICHTHDFEPDAPVHDVGQATGVLLQFMRR